MGKRFRQLTQTATDADIVEGNYFGVDTPIVTKKVPANLLAKQSALETMNGNVTALTTYAQNVAHSIAPEFDPTRDSEHAYPAGYSVTYTDGKVYTFTTPHYGAWTGSDVEVTNGANEFKMVNITAPGVYGGDLDDFPAQKCYRCVSAEVAANYAHKPAEQAFQLYCFGHTNKTTTKMQIFVSFDGKQYIRNKWASWSDWIELKAETPQLFEILDYDTTAAWSAGRLSRINDAVRMALKDIAASTSYNVNDWAAFDKGMLDYTMLWCNKSIAAGLFGNDLNNYPSNRMFRCASNEIGNAISHRPTGAAPQFMVITMGNTDSGSGYHRFQIYVGSDGKQYIRNKWASWSDWIELEAVPNYSLDNSANVLAVFDNVVCVGDSLTWSQVYTGNTSDAYRQAYNPYPKVVKKLCGMDSYQIIGYSGASSKGCWNNHNSELVEKTNALCIIFLGTNQGLTDSLTTDAPTSQPDYTQWANTNTGSYAKWVAKALDLGYRVLLVKPFTVAHSEDSDLETTWSVIDQVAARFGAAAMTAPRTLDNKYHYWPNGNGTNTLHYNDLGYAWFASALIHDVAQLSDAVLKLIIPQ